MLNDNWPHYLLIRLVILVFQWIAPACVGYTAWNVTQSWPEWPINTIFQAWTAAETAFFVIFVAFYRSYLQRPALHPPPRSKEERQALFAKVRAEVHDPEKYFRGWFLGAKVEDIGRDDVKDFLNWSFWDGRADIAHNSADEEEVCEYISKVEKMMRVPFRIGKCNATSLQLTLDPVEMECRTLLWYGLMMLADTITHLLMKRNGFGYFKTPTTSTWVYPPRPAAVLESARSPATAISYWMRPHTSKTRLPILYIHGIGVGLISHLKFFQELDQALNSNVKEDGQVGILAIEVLQVSSRLARPILRRREFLEQLQAILDFHEYDRFILASHSYGSVLATHVLNNDTLAARVSASLFIDPVTFLLHNPDVAYNFTRRNPRSSNEWLMWYFASQDPGVAHTLGRHFFWYENVLWRDRVTEMVGKGMKITASLASADLIVDTQTVGMYLTEHSSRSARSQVGETEGVQSDRNTYGTANQWKQLAWTGSGIEVVWWEGFNHAQVYDLAATRARLVDILCEYSRDR